LEYRAWVATALGDQEQATMWFAAALDASDGCTQRDRYLEANCTQALAALALERFDRAAWAQVVRRRATFDWSADGLREHRFFIALRAAVYAYDVEGDPLQAAWEARCAEEWAPTDAFAVQALCCRAQIARKARESVSQRNHVEAAYRLFAAIGISLGDGDAAMVPLVLAEELANAGRANDAREMVALYRSRSSMSPLLSMAHDPRVAGFETLVEAQVLEAEGNVREAVGAYRDAFRFFSGIRSLRRSLTAAVRLIRLAPEDETVREHVATIAAGIPKGSWIAPLAEGLRRANAARSLSATQRAYLTLLCDGRSNPEIARLRGRSVNTVRNQVAVLFDIFGVQSRAELVAQCARLGILDLDQA
jgi:DNA-binding CsgD family transcriptional regulator